MTNYFYTDASGQKQGPVDDQQLQALATQGIITPESPLELDNGLKGTAEQIPSLKFAESPVPSSSSTDAKPKRKKREQSDAVVEGPLSSPTNAQPQSDSGDGCGYLLWCLVGGGIVGWLLAAGGC